MLRQPLKLGHLYIWGYNTCIHILYFCFSELAYFLNMCICIYVHVCIHIYIYIYTQYAYVIHACVIRTDVYIYIYICLCVCVYIYIYIYTQAHGGNINMQFCLSAAFYSIFTRESVKLYFSIAPICFTPITLSYIIS